LELKDVRLSPELLVFAIALNAVGHAALYDAGPASQRDVAIECLRGGHIFGLVTGAILYAAHAYARDISHDKGRFVVVIFWLSAVLSVASLVMATWTEILMAKAKGQH